MKNMKSGDAGNVVHIKTDRLLLRNIMPSDVDFLVRLWTDPDITAFMGGPRDENRLRETLEADARNPFKEEFDLWILLEKATGQPVGHCGLLRKDVEGSEEIELNYIINSGSRGKGYATETAQALLAFAFEEKKPDSVIALIKPGNEASIRVAVKTGMEPEKEVIRQENTKMLLFRKRMEHNLQDAAVEAAPSIELMDENIYPDDDILKSILNDSFQAYEELLDLFAEHGLTIEWRYYRDGKAWLCKVQKKKKTIVWMSVWKDFMQATIYFPEKYLEKVYELDISEALKDNFRSAKNAGKLKPCTFQIRDAGILNDFGTVMKYKIECK